MSQANTLGARKHEQLVDTLKAADLTLSAVQRKRLDDASAGKLGFPHDFLASDQIRGLACGRAYGLTDAHCRR